MIARTDAVRDMCAEMGGITVAFEKVEARFLQHTQPNGKCRDLGQLTGKLAEIHTLERAEELVRRHPETMAVYWLGERTREQEREYAPANDGTPNIVVYNNARNPIGEIDMVMLVKEKKTDTPASGYKLPLTVEPCTFLPFISLKAPNI